jgi:lipoyl-dependent peroxiredoxin subunit D
VSSLETLRGAIPDAAKDIRLNLQSVLAPGTLSPAQRWQVAISSAMAARHQGLVRAVIAEASAELGAEVGPVLEDAKAAAALMAMNNVFYRFRHQIGKETYSQKPARLRMNRLVQVTTKKVEFELACLAVSAINGCEACVRSHEKVVLDGGLTEDHVLEAVRIASVLHAAAVALEIGQVETVAQPAADAVA